MPDETQGGLPPEPETNPAELDSAITDDTTTEDTSTPEDQQSDDSKQPPKGVQKRINELTRERHEERRRANQLEQMLIEILPRLLPQETPKTPARNPLIPPDPTHYPAGKYDPDYYEAVADFKAASQVEAYKQQQAKAEIDRIEQQARQEIAEKERVFTLANPNYQQAREAFLATPEIANHPGIGKAILESDSPPALIHWLWSNPEEAFKIAGLSEAKAIKAIGRIEDQLAGASGQPAPAGTKAPTPPTPVKGIGSSSVPTSSRQARTTEEYMRLRAKELENRR